MNKLEKSVRLKSRSAKQIGIASLTAVGIVAACTMGAGANKPNYIFKPAPKPEVVASIAGEEVTEEQLTRPVQNDLFELKKHEYQIKMQQLEQIMVERLIGAEAKKASMSLEDYINKKVVGNIKISDKDVSDFITERRIPDAQVTPEMKQRVVSHLTGERRRSAVTDYLGKLTKSRPVEVYFEEPKQIVTVDAAGGPSFGPENAKVTIVEFSDFQCPYCAQGADVVEKIRKKYGKQVRFVFRNMPLEFHQNARGAAEAALCAQEQSGDKFWIYHDHLFKNQDKLDKENLLKFGKESGLDTAKFEECVNSKRTAALVQKDIDAAMAATIQSTPTFVINGEKIPGALKFEMFAEKIDRELKNK